MTIKVNPWIFLIGALLLTARTAISQTPQLPQLTEKSRISLLTCAAGDALYYAFGHSAFRVQDSILGIDVVYNYGTFDFNRPHFYLNFAKGKLIYTLSRSSFEAFVWTYDQEKRWVREQVLNLTLKQKTQLFAFFETNYLPQNREYLYDPLFNNCSSITGDILTTQLGDPVVLDSTYLKKQSTFRQLVHQHLKANSWGGLAIDIVFGAVTDRKATAQEHLFLPYYALQHIRHSTNQGKPLLKKEQLLLEYKERPYHTAFLRSPLFWFTLLLLLTGWVTYRNLKYGTRSRGVDFCLFFIPGVVGIGLLLLWLATDHTVTVTNFEILWAFPLNTIVAFGLLFRTKLPAWLPYYIGGLLGLLLLLLLLWITKVQSFSPVLLPLWLTLALRYLYLLKQAKP